MPIFSAIFRQLLPIFLIISPFTGIHAGNPDSTLFSSDFEHRIFQQIADSSDPEPVSLFIAMEYRSENMQIESKIASFTNELQGKIKPIATGKKLKTIFTAVHNKFLDHYDEEAFFDDIFDNGKYNCVTASALFAIILDRLAIPYVIKETPVHVYLIADPGVSEYVIESTLPGEKMVQFDGRFKSNFVEYLHNNKIISEAEFRNSSTEDLFNKHYSNDQTINLKQLAGIQYYNKGVFLFNKALYHDALVHFEKAEMLHPEDIIRYMKNNSLLNVLNEENKKKVYDGKILARYILANDSNSMGIEYGMEYFNAVTHELVINHPNIDAYKKYYEQLSEVMDSENDFTDLKQTYYFYLGYYEASRQEYAQALQYLEKAYLINPDNINTKQLINEALVKCYANETNFSGKIESLENYFRIFTSLWKDKYMLKFLEYYYAATISSLYEMGNETTGLAVLRRYEKFLAEHKDFEHSHEYIRDLYSSVGLYYANTGKPDLGETILRRGIRLCPECGEIKGILRSTMIMRGGHYEYPELMEDGAPMKKYLIALANSKDNQSAINDSVKVCIQQEWLLSDLPENILNSQNTSREMHMSLHEGGRFTMNSGHDSYAGKWSYNSSNCTLSLFPDQKQESFHILIEMITPLNLKGLIYKLKNYTQVADVTFTAVP